MPMIGGRNVGTGAPGLPAGSPQAATAAGQNVALTRTPIDAEQLQAKTNADAEDLSSKQSNFQQAVTDLPTYLQTVMPFTQPNTSIFSSFGAAGAGGAGGRVGAPSVGLDTGAINAGASAAFSRAKDQVGRTSNAAIQGLQNAMSARGIGASSLAGNGLAQVYDQGLGELADTSRASAIDTAGRATDLAKTAFSGGITQRGQDLTTQSQAADRALRAAEDTQAASVSRSNQIAGLIAAFKGLY